MTHMYRGLKNHILKAGLIPILALSLSFGVLSTLLSLHQSQIIFEKKVSLTSSQLSLLLAAALDMNDRITIQRVTRVSLQHEGLRSLRVSNSRGEALHDAGPPLQMRDWAVSPVLRPQQLEDNSSILITTRLATSHPDHQGLWLELEFDRNANLVNQYQWILLGSLICALCLLLATVFSLRLGNSISIPLERITTALSQINVDDLTARIPPSYNPHLNVLIRNLNILLAKLQISYRDARAEVEMVADELKKNMETLELNNAELDLSRKRAMQANKSKTVFLANMSHEMRTPLNSIFGYAELLMRSQLEDSQREHLRTLTTAADSLLAIIDDILDFSKLEAGKLVLERSPLNLRTVIDDVLAMNSPCANKKKLELTAIVPNDVPVHLTGDTNRLKQILSNLISNAIKFTDSGSVVIQVHSDKHSDTHANLHISVKDTGIGIHPEDARKLFKAFSQVDSSRNRNTNGTGLGLVICKSLVEQMQGSIGFDSQPGRGARFWFTLRLPLNPQFIPIEPIPCGTALVIEAKSSTRKSVCLLLESEGYQVSALDNLPSPEQLEKNKPSLVVMGDQPITDIRHIPDNCPIVMVTAAERIEKLSGILDQDRIAAISYPLSQKRLQEALTRICPERQSLDHPYDKTASSIAQQGLRVLAVDDNEPNRKLLHTLLTDAGITTDTAASGFDALDLISQHTYDMVFMDVQMPGIDGLETTLVCGDQESDGHHLPVIALTAHALAEEKRELTHAGMDDYLTKPVSEQQLLHTISYWAEIKPQGTRNLPVNWQEGIQLAGGREELADELLSMLLGTLEETREALLSSQQLNDVEALLTEVHKLHGAARYCGTRPLRMACQELELHLKRNLKEDEGLKNCGPLFNIMLEEIDRLLIWRRRYTQEVAQL
ncbi:response regulator [Sansalvadorimonas verongulae]|uniref:response regulator n=1 Tax=Sansalvadorimonas verongulae TaxID=2172824 RepID=UPI0012BD6B39|nr:response regulator [Sansalvadorimonas verongulae]MTI15167.1 response regulator [Sansalvadorimonas verongulae]